MNLAKHFEKLVRQDSRFEVKGDVIFGLVCFRLKVRRMHRPGYQGTSDVG